MNEPFSPQTPRYISPAGDANVLPATPHPRRTTDRRDAAAALVLLVLSVLGVSLSLFGGFHLGYTVSYLAITGCGLIYLSGRRIAGEAGGRCLRATPFACFCLLAALAGAGVFVWHNDAAGRFLLFCGMVFLTMLALCEATGNGSGATIGAVRDAACMLLIRPIQHLSALRALFLARRGDAVEKRRCGPVLIGILCAIPALLVLVPLLIGADAAFESLLQHTVLDHLGDAFISLLLGFALFVLLFCRLYSLRYTAPQKAAPAATERRGADAAAVNAFLGVICGLYLLYLFAQLAYFVSAFAGILPENYTVAQYARRGFFEMCAISLINLLIAALTLLISRRQEGRAPLSTRLLLLFVLLFSIGMVATALSKMVLYIGSFGMTRLRLLTGLFMLMLAGMLLFVCIRLFRPRFAYMRAGIIVIALLGLLAAYADVDTVIARYNVRAWQAGTLKQMDVEALAELSDGAVPYLFELYNSRDKAIAARAAEALYDRLETLPQEKTGLAFLRSYNIDAARARALLTAHAEPLREHQEEMQEKMDETAYSGEPESYNEQRLAEAVGLSWYSQQATALGYAGDCEIYLVCDPTLTAAPGTRLTIGNYVVEAAWQSTPDPIGVYAVLPSGEVKVLRTAYKDGDLSIEAVYPLLPAPMQGGKAPHSKGGPANA